MVGEFSKLYSVHIKYTLVCKIANAILILSGIHQIAEEIVKEKEIAPNSMDLTPEGLRSLLTVQKHSLFIISKCEKNRNKFEVFGNKFS